MCQYILCAWVLDVSGNHKKYSVAKFYFHIYNDAQDIQNIRNVCVLFVEYILLILTVRYALKYAYI
jgi:hypothetical protein